MNNIDIESRIKSENNYIELLKEELKLKLELIRMLTKHSANIHEKIKTVDLKKDCFKIQVDIVSKERFVEGLKKHIQQS